VVLQGQALDVRDGHIEVLGDVGEVATEGGVGQPEVPGQREDGRRSARGLGEFVDGQLVIFD
jgi:hypothetical protein